MFRLARALGKTVREMLAGMHSRELSEWMALHLIEAEEAEKEAGDPLAAAAARNLEEMKAARRHRRRR